MTAPAAQVQAFELDRIAHGDMLAARDALETLRNAVNAVALVAAKRVGRWQDVAYAAGNFTTNGGGAWTVLLANQLRYRYVVIDNVLLLDVALSGTVIGAVGTTELRIALPAGYKATGTTGTVGAMAWSDSTPQARMGAVIAAGGGAYVSCERYDTTVAAAFGNGLTVALAFTMAIDILPTNLGIA